MFRRVWKRRPCYFPSFVVNTIITVLARSLSVRLLFIPLLFVVIISVFVTLLFFLLPPLDSGRRYRAPRACDIVFRPGLLIFNAFAADVL